jgi:two-component system phosphate regulon sensor histidine kinase PhoR
MGDPFGCDRPGDRSRARRFAQAIAGVRDNRPAIPSADLPHLFARFCRADKGRSRRTGGTGLGLSMVKHIVQLHGGRVWIDSGLGTETTLRFTLPQWTV